jgi:hypothetical protein
MPDKRGNCADLEIGAQQFQDAVAFAYNENCPINTRKYNRNTSWWNQDLEARRKEVRKLFNIAKR